MRPRQTPKPFPSPEQSAFSLDDMVLLGDGSRAYLYNEIAEGRLRAVKRGRRTVVLAEDRSVWRKTWTGKTATVKPQRAKAAPVAA